MSLEDATQQYDSILENIRKFYSQTRSRSKKHYTYPSSRLEVQDKNAGFKVLKAGSIDEALKSGGIVMNNGKTYGNKKDIEHAKYLKMDYQDYKKEIGDAIKELYNKDAEYDGYAFLDLGKNIYAAHIEADGKKILAVNKDYADWMNNPVKKREIFGHESIHNIGERDEHETNQKNAELNNYLAGKLEAYIARLYKQVAEDAYQRVPCNEYGMPCSC